MNCRQCGCRQRGWGCRWWFFQHCVQCFHSFYRNRRSTTPV